MADKKLTYQMVSPGEAWNNFVNSKDGHNAAAVTPSYLDNTKNQQAPPLPFNIKKDNNKAPDLAAGEQKSQQVLSKEDVTQQKGMATLSQQKDRENIRDSLSGNTKTILAPKKNTKSVSKEIERER